MSTENSNVTRRDFVRTSAALAAGTLAAGTLPLSRSAFAGGTDTVRVGVVGCGGRGTGAAYNALEASPQVRITALGDLFANRLNNTRQRLASDHPDRATLDDDQCFTGFDAYKSVAASDADYVILATPPHFRPMQIAEVIRNGKNLFTEKPAAVDPTGIRTVLAAGEEADRKGLSVVAGTQRRHESCYREMMQRIADGAIGEVVSARCWWNQGGLWVVERTPSMTDMEWQLRNWLYFTWLSGDHIVEQHVHNLDACNWAMGAHPIKCMGMGGRQVRTDPKFGNIFDHFAIGYEYPGGRVVSSQCRQIDNCAGRVAESILGSTGHTWSQSGQARIMGENSWRFTDKNPNPYVIEHRDLVDSITGQGSHHNEARQVAESTLTAIMGRMSAYTGKEVTWEEALNSKLNLSPPSYEFGPLPVRPVAVPGRTPLV